MSVLNQDEAKDLLDGNLSNQKDKEASGGSAPVSKEPLNRYERTKYSEELQSQIVELRKQLSELREELRFHVEEFHPQPSSPLADLYEQEKKNGKSPWPHLSLNELIDEEVMRQAEERKAVAEEETPAGQASTMRISQPMDGIDLPPDARKPEKSYAAIEALRKTKAGEWRTIEGLSNERERECIRNAIYGWARRQKWDVYTSALTPTSFLIRVIKTGGGKLQS
ncbi:centrosome and spindle pole-associated protein 1 [uncultured Mediterranean phage uvDeep-CGR2-AD3-C191]|nr:centrosome and spindle pole-associated protein 1 [uncultured Mediterranean phage uvDeep-CGR2-AD3-C191]